VAAGIISPAIPGTIEKEDPLQIEVVASEIVALGFIVTVIVNVPPVQLPATGVTA
jgi:hypothetical protein